MAEMEETQNPSLLGFLLYAIVQFTGLFAISKLPPREKRKFVPDWERWL